MIGDEGRDEMPLEKARSVAQAVAHRRGGTDQALARLDKEIARYQKCEELIKEMLQESPELEADIPDQLWRNIANNREQTAKAIRLSVIVSKRKLKELIEGVFDAGKN